MCKDEVFLWAKLQSRRQKCFTAKINKESIFLLCQMQMNCPSDTEYQCLCGGKLYCYGYNQTSTQLAVKLVITSLETYIPITYTCTSDGCTAVYDGSGVFATIEACQSLCVPTRWSCVDGSCIQTIDGIYATLEECQASGCGASSTRITITVRTSGLICGVIAKTNVAYLGTFNTFDYATERWQDETYNSGSCDTPFTAGSPTGPNGIWVCHFNSDQGQFYIFIALNNTFPVQSVVITPV